MRMTTKATTHARSVVAACRWLRKLSTIPQLSLFAIIIPRRSHIMSAASSYLLVAVAGIKPENEANALKRLNSLGLHISYQAPAVKFGIPVGEESLKFGSFDTLVRLSDDLQKSDGQVEACLRRLERQLQEVDPEAQFQVLSQRVRMNFDQYTTNWRWDEAKYPSSRGIAENMQVMLTIVGKLDEESRSKATQYNEIKTGRSNIDKRDVGNLASKDLVDILTPEVVRDDDFVSSEHITTVVVVIGKGGEQEFLNSYEMMDDRVVPQSASRLTGVGTDDKDGNTLWRVVLFKAGVENFKKNARERKITVRDFVYDAKAFSSLQAQRREMDVKAVQTLDQLKGTSHAAWSDVMIAWMHIKAMRVFVESVLRYGPPPHFDTYLVPVNTKSMPRMRSALGDWVQHATHTSFNSEAEANLKAAEAEGEEYFPYVSFSFSPFAVVKA